MSQVTESPMKKISLEKVVLNMGIGKSGDVIDIAKNILKDNQKIDLSTFKKIFDNLSIESLKNSMNLIRADLKALGISHDNFVSEKSLVERNFVAKTIQKLKETKFVEESIMSPPKGEENND